MENTRVSKQSGHVSNKNLLNRQAWQGITGVPPGVTSYSASTAGPEPAREMTMGFEPIPLTPRARRLRFCASGHAYRRTCEWLRSFLVNCDVYIYRFGASLEREKPDGSVRAITYISRAPLDSERHWTPLDLEAGGIVWAITHLRGYLWGTKFRIFSCLLYTSPSPRD